MMRWTRILMILAALSTAIAGKVAFAVDFAKASADFGPEGTWSNNCEIDRMTDVKICRLMAYRLFDEGRDTGFVALTFIPNGNDYHLFITTSQGMIDNCAIRVDRQPRLETQIATINMCMFPNFLSGKFLDQFKNGSTVLVRINFLRAGRRDIDFTLNGFGRTFDEMQRNLH